MIVLGIDPGGYKTGFGVVVYEKDDFKLIDSGVIKLNKELSQPKRLELLYDECMSLIGEYNIEFLSLEKAFYHKNVQTTLRIGEARAAFLISAAKRNLYVCEFSPKEIKKAVTGNGSASKEQVRYVVRKFFNLNFNPSFDESDAIAAAMCLCLKNNLNKINQKRKNKADWKTFIINNPERIVQ